MNLLEALFPVGIGLIFAVIHYYSSALIQYCGGYKQRLQSGVVGISVAYLLLQFFPQSILSGEVAGIDIGRLFLFIAIGFVLTFILDQLLTKNKKESCMNGVLFAALHLSIGLLLMLSFSFNTLQGWIFLVWAILFSAISNCSLGEVGATLSKAAKIIFASMTLIGILTAAFLPIPVVWLLVLQAMVTGVLTFLIMREMASAQSGELFFVIGMIIAGAIILLI